MRLPRSTYRLQLNADFRLTDVHALLDYFQTLGISDLYLSPLLQARAGSTHGYDVIDPGHVNRETASDEEFEQLATALQRRGMGILLDIVPNHMSATEANPWWRDVMEHGRASAFAGFFDIDWESETAGEGRLLLPFLGQSLDQCIAAGEVRLVIHDREVAIAYFDRRLPIDAASLPTLTRAVRANLGKALPAVVATELQSLARLAAQLPSRAQPERSSQRRLLARELKNRLADALGALPEAPATALTAQQLTELLERQPYTLFYWVPGGRQINYRRFFDITELAGLRSEDPDVFAALHQRIIPWLSLGTIGGVRIDHIDGLLDPAGYLRQLSNAVAATTGKRPYIVVEKILIGAEQLPGDWCTAGTTGYDFIGMVNGLFVEPRGSRLLQEVYAQATGISDFTELLRQKKRQVLTSLFPGELRGLVQRLSELLPDAAQGALEFALVELTACLPVYRTYITNAPHETDYGVIDEALAGARERGADAVVVDWLRSLLLEPQTATQLEFILRWQQLTGPVTAKGLEDTAFYNYHSLVSTCEVGSDPRQPVASVDDFHQHMQRRQAEWPGTLNSTSTHDTKRSEDVRARINVLSELAQEWIDLVGRWRALHARCRRQVQDLEAPDATDEILLYQTLIGAWPLDDAGHADFEQRIRDYMLKAVREAKRRTSWRAQNPEFEAAVLDFTSAVLRPENRAFRDQFLPFERRTAFYGALNSLSQLVLKLGAPGVPDFYQGTELWSLALTDPDNRRPVDFVARQAALEPVDIEQAKQNWRDGRLKALITARGLRLRNQNPALFARGEYLAVNVVGPRARNVIAFERRLGNQRALFVATRFFTELCAPDQWPTAQTWQDTCLCFEEPAASRDLVTARICDTGGGPALSAVLGSLPCALLVLDR